MKLLTKLRLVKVATKLSQLIKSLIKLIKRLKKSHTQFIKSIVCLLRAFIKSLIELNKSLGSYQYVPWRVLLLGGVRLIPQIAHYIRLHLTSVLFDTCCCTLPPEIETVL